MSWRNNSNIWEFNWTFFHSHPSIVYVILDRIFLLLHHRQQLVHRPHQISCPPHFVFFWLNKMQRITLHPTAVLNSDQHWLFLWLRILSSFCHLWKLKWRQTTVHSHIKNRWWNNIESALRLQFSCFTLNRCILSTWDNQRQFYILIAPLINLVLNFFFRNWRIHWIIGFSCHVISLF